MNQVRTGTARWLQWGMRFMPFADAVSEDLPLSRLLRLSLFQVSVGMALVLLVGTLNRVMIVELKVSASLVSVMVAMPLLFAPFRAVVGFRSDHHRSELGWRRVPYIWMGTLMQFGGFAIMPFALLVLAGMGQSSSAPLWVGHLACGLAFLLVGAGLHTVQTAGLALATDLSTPEKMPRVVGFLYVMMLLGMIGSALVFGDVLSNFSPGRLIQVIQGAAILTLVLNVLAMWKQEARRRDRKPSEVAKTNQDPDFSQAWHCFVQGKNAIRHLIILGLGTMAFTMEDVLLEPYGGEILGLNVSATTYLSATLAMGSLIGFIWASHALSKGMDAIRMSAWGAWIGVPGLVLVILAEPLAMTSCFVLGVGLIGLGAGLFGHGTLTATMQRSARHEVGLALGAWGAVQATAGGLALALGGLLRDAVASMTSSWTGYSFVYSIEAVMLVVTLVAMRGLSTQAAESSPSQGSGSSTRLTPFH